MQRDFKGIWIPKEIWLSEELNIQEKCLLVEIDSLSSLGKCFASNEHFSKFLGLSKDRISKMISGLKNKGFVEVELVYKNGTKEIDKRIITTIGYRQKQLEPIVKNTDTPIGENAEDNNTSINNTINKSVSPDGPTEIPIIVEKILKNSQSSAFYKDERLLIEETVRTICNDGNIATKLKLGLTNLQIRDRILTLEIKHLDRAIKRYQERKNTVTNTVMYFAKILVESINIAGAEEIKHREDNDDD